VRQICHDRLQSELLLELDPVPAEMQEGVGRHFERQIPSGSATQVATCYCPFVEGEAAMHPYPLVDYKDQGDSRW